MPEELEVKSKEQLINIINEHEEKIIELQKFKDFAIQEIKKHREVLLEIEKYFRGYSNSSVAVVSQKSRTPVKYFTDCIDDFMDWF